MSNVQSSSYETYESHGPDGTSRPSVAHDAGTLPYGTGAPPYGTEAETLPYGAGTPPYEAETLPYGVYADTVHADTYRPAYAARTVPDRRPAEPDGPFSGAGAAGEGGEGGSRRAVRRRRAADRPGSLRRLVPQALVVAFLAGGTSAFVAKDKAIELTVDGRPRTLHTFADDVSELLADEGVAFGAHDVVAPAPGTALSSGDEVAVHYGRPVALTLDGRRRQVWTTARTVDGALQQLGVRAEGAYVSTSRSQRIGRQGLELDVRTERTVTIMTDGRTRTIRTNAATVGEAVEQAGITLRGEDTTSVDASSFPRDGQTVTVLRVTGSTEVREVLVPFRVHRVEDPSLFRGTEVVERAGRPGTRRITYALRTVNGVRQRPRLLRTEVVREPRDQVVKVGTKAMPTSVAGAEGLNWAGLAACESGA
ncbi:ubiquitin-like domain-containing protein, partial [Streptomyces sp. IBSBF 2950]|uniref:ubiquitin-like domain-containing protein n=1 Tax=Streptomyces sp. IBSBF 2950 TaxID=2903528 RepID=UPI002FDC60C7